MAYRYGLPVGGTPAESESLHIFTERSVARIPIIAALVLLLVLIHLGKYKIHPVGSRPRDVIARDPQDAAHIVVVALQACDLSILLTLSVECTEDDHPDTDQFDFGSPDSGWRW